MAGDLTTLANPLMENIGPVGARTAQRAEALNLPDDAVIVSADNHWEVSEDIFFEAFPSALKDKAPRVWLDANGRPHLGYQRQLVGFGAGDKVDRMFQRGLSEGAWNLDVRLRDLDTEGARKEVVFPQSLLGFVRHPEFAVQETIYRIYNGYIAELGTKAPGRFHGVGVFGNWWEPAQAEPAMRQIVDLGLKTFMIPTAPGKDLDGKSIDYGDPGMERFWDVVAEAGLPVNFHVGENVDTEHRGGLATTVLAFVNAFRKPLGQLIFGGVFDRCPNLKVVFSEGGLAWIPPALQDAEMIYDSFGNGDLFEAIEHRPSWYWRHNCYATFQNDLLGLTQLDHIGADRVMWAADYPHSEGSHGYAWSSMKSVVDAAGPEVAQQILGDTALEVYGL